MLTEPTQAANRLPGIVLIATAMLLALALYLPVTWQFLESDDFLTIRDLQEAPSAAAFLTTRVSDHFQPALMTTYLLDHALFGDHWHAYHWLNLLLHCANVGLVGLLGWRLLGPLHGGLGACGFAAADTYFRAVSWWSTRGFLLSLFFLLLAILLLLRYSRTLQWRHLAATLALYLLMMLSFSYGLESCLLFPLLFLVDGERWRQPRALPRLLLPFLPFPIVAICTFLVARHMAATQENDIGAMLTSMPPTDLVAQLFHSLWGGIVDGFGSAVTGARLWMPWLAQMGIEPLRLRTAAFVVVLAAIVSLLDFRSPRFQKLAPLCVVLLLWGLALYTIPILPRMSKGPDWFTYIDRYRYLPTAFFMPAALALIRCTRPFTRSIPAWRFLRYAIIAVAAVVVIINIGQTRQRMAYALGETQRLEKMTHAYIGGLRKEIAALPPGERLRVIHDVPPEIDYASWNARSGYLCALFLTPKERKKLEGISLARASYVKDQRLLYPEYGTGVPRPYRSPAPPRNLEKNLASGAVCLREYEFELPAKRLRDLRLQFQFLEPGWGFVKSLTLEKPGLAPQTLEMGATKVRTNAPTSKKINGGLLLQGRPDLWFDQLRLQGLDLRGTEGARLKVLCAAPPDFVLYLNFDYGLGFTRENREWQRLLPCP